MNDLTFNTLTIVVLAILVISTLIGMKRGLIRTILSLFSMIIAAIFAWILYPYVSGFLSDLEPLQQTIYTPVNTFFTENFPELIAGLIDAAGSAEQNTFINELPLPQLIKDTLTLNNTPDAYAALGAESFIEYLSTTVTSLIIQALALLLTMIVAFICLHLLMTATDLIAKLPVISSLNTVGGAIAGLVTGYLIMQILFLGITTFSGTEWGMSLMQQINESSILTFLYGSSAMIKMIISELAKHLEELTAGSKG